MVLGSTHNQAYRLSLSRGSTLLCCLEALNLTTIITCYWREQYTATVVEVKGPAYNIMESSIAGMVPNMQVQPQVHTSNFALGHTGIKVDAMVMITYDYRRFQQNTGKGYTISSLFAGLVTTL